MAQVPQVDAQRWVFSASLRETLTDNLFLIAPEGPGESITGGTLSLAYNRVEDRYSLSGLGWVNGQLFNQYDSYNGANFGLGVYGQRDFTKSLRGRLGLSYADGLNLGALYSSRVGLPQLDIKTGYADTGLSYELSPGTSISGSFDAHRDPLPVGRAPEHGPAARGQPHSAGRPGPARPGAAARRPAAARRVLRGARPPGPAVAARPQPRLLDLARGARHLARALAPEPAQRRLRVPADRPGAADLRRGRPARGPGRLAAHDRRGRGPHPGLLVPGQPLRAPRSGPTPSSGGSPRSSAPR